MLVFGRIRLATNPLGVGKAYLKLQIFYNLELDGKWAQIVLSIFEKIIAYLKSPLLSQSLF